MTSARARSIFAVALLFVIVACATQPRPPPDTIVVSPGFFFGLLHGFIFPFSLIGSLFTNVRVYAFPNTGFFYDLGFFLGAAAILGGGGATARR